MQVEILYRPSYSLARVTLGGNETIRAEGGAMVSMSASVTLETKATGGILKSLARSVLGGESFFMNTYRAPADGGEITLAPALPGDIVARPIQNESFMVQSGAYLASDESVNVDTKWGGAKTFFASEGLIMLRCSGTGMVLFSSYGAIHEKDLAAGETYTVDTGHLVAFTEGIGFKVRSVGGIKSTLFSGEGLVVDLTGPGKAFLQTRSQDAFLAWLLPLLPKPDSK
ncbi:MAG: TIGR00266 family protein [Chloroflexi bacterium]|nr:TIGR00266 family protein [Chloroflexota bacterium]MBU1748614.1 TIGR00266 family protein [Chloroflexota bacterium]MBU1878658.1 TIGR00266 family protein [Chloroflexota bacterium]